MEYEIWNRRYTGSKYKLSDWIFEIIDTHCAGSSFCDIFAGTGIIAYKALTRMNKVVLNDFLYSNEVIYNAFFLQEPYSVEKIVHYSDEFNKISTTDIKPNYVSEHFAEKYFSKNDALIIGEIRDRIEQATELSKKERSILIASLLYSIDRIANTVGHYDAYIKGHYISDKFKFELISPYKTNTNIAIYRQDANDLAKSLECDIVYIDPPYNSRQYSRFYHLLENITTWKKPNLYGVAEKPLSENMSEYCRNTALQVFTELICDLRCKYILVSYNNTYASKSSSSLNKMTIDNIRTVLMQKGELKCFERSHHFFNAGKTDFSNHKELLFLIEVKQ